MLSMDCSAVPSPDTTLLLDYCISPFTRLLTQAGCTVPRNTMADGSSAAASTTAWPPSLSPVAPLGLSAPPPSNYCTPAGPMPLTISPGATPCNIPMLPLLSPGATPALGIGPGALISTSTGRSLEHVVSVATDPLSLHFVNLNMVSVDLDEDSMDALMMQGRPAGPCPPLAPLAPALQPAPYSRPSALRQAHPAATTAAHTGVGAPRTGSQGGCAAQTNYDCDSDFDADMAEVEQAMAEVCGGDGGGKGFYATSAFRERRRSSAHSSNNLLQDANLAAGQADGWSPTLPLLSAGSGSRDCGAGAAGGSASAPVTAPTGVGSEGDDGEPPLNLTVPFLEDNGYFDMTLQQAAGQLGVGVTTLKKLCRQNGLGRWPYRARCSLRKLRDKMREYFAGAPVEERDAADALMGREFSRLARMNVGAIDEAVKQFRQAMFKLEFKARQQLEAARGNSSGRKRAAEPGSGAGAGPDADLNAIIHTDDTIRQQAMLHLRRLLSNFADEH